jgi:hypothetical protein
MKRWIPFALTLMLLSSTVLAQGVYTDPNVGRDMRYPARYRLNPYPYNYPPPANDPNTAIVGRPYDPYYGPYNDPNMTNPNYDPNYGGSPNDGNSANVPFN